MSRTVELLALLRNTDKEFHRIHRTRGLTRKDKQELEHFYIDRVFTQKAAGILRGSANGPAAPLRLLNAKDLESWLKIDRKTIYSYVVRKLIPHIRIESNVRFVEPEIRRWLERHHFRARRRNIKRALAHGVLLSRAALE